MAKNETISVTNLSFVWLTLTIRNICNVSCMCKIRKHLLLSLHCIMTKTRLKGSSNLSKTKSAVRDHYHCENICYNYLIFVICHQGLCNEKFQRQITQHCCAPHSTFLPNILPFALLIPERYLTIGKAFHSRKYSEVLR